MNIIFDFDGTVCDSFELTIQILNKYLAKLHRKLIDKYDFREKGIEELVEDYKLNKVQVFIYVLQGRREIAKHINTLTSFEGMPEVLSELSKNHTLGIVSSNSKKNIDKFLRNNNLKKYFTYIKSSSNLFGKARILKKLKPDFYIGDEVRDIEAAKKAGVKSIAVSWGYESKNLLKKSKPDFLIDRPRELTRITK